MESRLKPISLVTILALLASSNLENWANAEPQVPCYFIFGDSLSDNGNNNNLATLAKVNYLPYGIDFPEGPTGRFSNGQNMQDFIVKLLGFKEYMPPFANTTGKNILTGVNYASGAAGIRDETGLLNQGARIPFNRQIRNHRIIISRIKRLTRNDSDTKSLLKKCIYSIQFGSNDYINNYFNPKYITSRLFTLPQYASVLVEQLAVQLESLYELGARNFAVYGVGLIGCAPEAIRVYGTNGSVCVDKLNEGAALFNEKLKPMIPQLNNDFSDAKFTYLNPSGTAADLSSFVTNGTCCITGGGAGELCLRNSKPCDKPRRFLFWDGFHTSEAWNEIIAESAYSSESPDEAFPFNIQQLAND